MSLTLSCAFATSPQSHEHARIAESLGYERAFFYDSPPLYPDVWVQLCRAAERTEHIGLGPGVLVPSNRHPMTNAAAIATLVDVAGADRVTVAVGSGFTGRMAMGKRALPWAFVAEYVRALQGLLRGDGGPKGIAAAHELGDGVFGTVALAGFDWSVALVMGTVLRNGEAPDSERCLAAAGHAGAVMLHYGYEHGLLPEEQAREWLASYQDIPDKSRHLAMHYGPPV